MPQATFNFRYLFGIKEVMHIYGDEKIGTSSPPTGQAKGAGTDRNNKSY